MTYLKPSAYLREVALLFLRLGATSFGGPAAYIGLMHLETVQRRHWLDDRQFLDLVGATNLIPGPNATEMAIHLGFIRAGLPGLVAAGTLFILPGMLATLVVAWAYVNYGSMPTVTWALYGIKPVVIAVVIQALWNLGKSGIKKPIPASVAVAVMVLSFLGVNEIVLLFAGATAVLIAYGGQHIFKIGMLSSAAGPLLSQAPLGAFSAGFVPFSKTTLFLTFLKIGSVLYGSGYVLLAFLRAEFVEKLGWLDTQELLNAIAAGQITPGPVFSSATFIGYLFGGWQSALLATGGIFLPSFLFVGLLSYLLPLVRKSPWASAFLDGVNAASLGLMAGVTVQLGRVVFVDIFAILLTLCSLFIIFRSKTSSIWLILGGGLLGLFYKLITG